MWSRSTAPKASAPRKPAKTRKTSFIRSSLVGYSGALAASRIRTSGMLLAAASRAASTRPRSVL